MKSLTLLLALLVFSGVVMPTATAFAAYQRAENPCGMVFCCCPQMCKMLKQKKLAGQMCERHHCGIKSASAAVSLSPFSVVDLRTAILSDSLADIHSMNSTLSPGAWRTFASAGRSALDK